MELLTAISALLAIVDSFFSVKDKFSAKPNKDNLAVWFKETADLVESVTVDLENKIYPHSKCAQMNFYLQNFYDIIKNELDKDRAEQVILDINEAYRVERLFGELNNISDLEKDKNLNALREIAGKFRALSDYIKLTK